MQENHCSLDKARNFLVKKRHNGQWIMYFKKLKFIHSHKKKQSGNFHKAIVIETLFSLVLGPVECIKKRFATKECSKLFALFKIK